MRAPKRRPIRERLWCTARIMRMFDLQQLMLSAQVGREREVRDFAAAAVRFGYIVVTNPAHRVSDRTYVTRGPLPRELPAEVRLAQ